MYEAAIPYYNIIIYGSRARERDVPNVSLSLPGPNFVGAFIFYSRTIQANYVGCRYGVVLFVCGVFVCIVYTWQILFD